MRVDAHVHLWERKVIPNEVIRQYLEPLKVLKDMGLDSVFDIPSQLSADIDVFYL